MKQRNPALVIIFGIITCGIYVLYWYVVTTNEVQAKLKSPDGTVASGGMVLLLHIVTCGIYTFYWWYKMGQRAAQLGKEYGVGISDNSAVYLILCFVGIGLIINTVLLQSDLNKIAAAPPTPPTTLQTPPPPIV